MPVFPAKVMIKHQAYLLNVDSGGSPILDADGNQTSGFADPVTRYIIGIQQTSPAEGIADPVTVDYTERVIIDMILEVPDSTLYKKWDRVHINNGVEWLSYEVQNRPVSWSQGFPWQRYSRIFGGTVHVRRVN